MISGTSMRDRAIGCLQGLALGDALGMPTQSFSPVQISERYGRLVGLVDATDDQPIAPGMTAGSVTDDTEQALLMGRLLVEGGGHIDPHELADALIEWEDSMRARGSLDLLGPSTRAAIEQLREGAPIGSTGAAGTTNGAAMRVAPVGIAVPAEDPARLMRVVEESCLLSHNTVQGIQSAGLVAVAVSAGVGGASPREAISHALDAVETAPGAGHWSARASVIARTRAALAGASGLSGEELDAYIRTTVGTSLDSVESVPAALTLVWHNADLPFEALLAAARMGGDTDTMGAIAGAILGACRGRAGFPEDQVATVEHTSHLHIEDLAERLLALRAGHREPTAGD